MRKTIDLTHGEATSGRKEMTLRDAGAARAFLGEPGGRPEREGRSQKPSQEHAAAASDGGPLAYREVSVGDSPRRPI